MRETRYINKDGTCNNAHIEGDDGSYLRIGSDQNIPQQSPLKPGDSLVIIPTHDMYVSYTLSFAQNTYG